MSVSRWMMLFVAGLATLALACGGSSDSGWNAQGIAESQQDAPFFPLIANSPFGLGPNRVAVGIIDQGALVSDAQVSVRFYKLADEPEDDPQVAELGSEAVATARSIIVTNDHVHDDDTVHVHEGPVSTIYVINVDFDVVGWWGIEVDVEIDGVRHEGVRLSNRWVSERSSEPGIGEEVPPSVQRTMRDVSDVTEIDSSSPPNPWLHKLTVAEALETGKPVVVAFVTPAFCETRFCGPVMEEVILPAVAEFGEVVEFIHIEPFDLAEMRAGRRVSVPTVEEWNLLSEPFVFVLNPDGTVAAKFEGIIEAEEITDALKAVLAS